jgi:hypothetical protein
LGIGNVGRIKTDKEMPIEKKGLEEEEVIDGEGSS